jgi:hypothetical protein
MRHWTWLAKLSQLFLQITCRSLTMMDCHIISGRSYRQRKGTSETDICSRDPQYRHIVDIFKPWLKRLKKFLGLLNPKVYRRIINSFTWPYLTHISLFTTYILRMLKVGLILFNLCLGFLWATFTRCSSKVSVASSHSVYTDRRFYTIHYCTVNRCASIGVPQCCCLLGHR